MSSNVATEGREAGVVAPATKPRSPFEEFDAADVRLLIESYPLAWVCAEGGDEASLLPLIGVFDAEGQLVELIGHFARSNPLNALFARDGRAKILFSGPDAYISPSQAGRRNWGPTWNYAQLRIKAEITVEPDLTAEALDLLIAHVEQGKAQPWTASELGERYAELFPHIVGFRARVTQLKGRFKLGQDEGLETLREILSNMEEGDLSFWMQRFNRERLNRKDGAYAE